VKTPRFGTFAAQFLLIIASERCARLPRSFANSLLMRRIMADWEKSPSLPNGTSRKRK